MALCDTEKALRTDGSQAEAGVVRLLVWMTGADDRIALVHQPVKRRRLQPRLLHELELPFEVGVQTHEEESRRLARGLAITAADAMKAMTIRDRQLSLRSAREALARVGAPDVRAERTPKGLRILSAEQKVVVGCDGDVAHFVARETSPNFFYTFSTPRRVDVRYFRDFGDFVDLTSISVTPNAQAWSDLSLLRIFFGVTVD